MLYDDFSENIGQRCYKSLIDLDIPIRLPLVRAKLDEIQHSPAVVAQMEIGLQKRRPELTEGEASERIARSIQEAVIMLESVEPQSEAVDADQLVRQADQAMYRAKREGKNRYYCFQDPAGQMQRPSLMPCLHWPQAGVY
mgnify:CR=1 FL=1